MTSQPERLKGEVYGLGGRLLDLLFPSRCVNCKQVNGALCSACLATIHPIASPMCERGAHPAPAPGTVCRECHAHPLSITHIQAVLWHEGAQREAVHALKFNRRRDVAPALAHLLAACLAQTNATFDLVTSVPLHPVREQERGYNQAELLAQSTARARNLPYTRLLQRTRATLDACAIALFQGGARAVYGLTVARPRPL